jgi:hypothetical protein
MQCVKDHIGGITNWMLAPWGYCSERGVGVRSGSFTALEIRPYALLCLPRPAILNSAYFGGD